MAHYPLYASHATDCLNVSSVKYPPLPLELTRLRPSRLPSLASNSPSPVLLAPIGIQGTLHKGDKLANARAAGGVSVPLSGSCRPPAPWPACGRSKRWPRPTATGTDDASYTGTLSSTPGGCVSTSPTGNLDPSSQDSLDPPARPRPREIALRVTHLSVYLWRHFEKSRSAAAPQNFPSRHPWVTMTAALQ